MNFTGHIESQYYVNCIFHRVVQGYVQAGDPENDGTGGESIWGGKFEDEIFDDLKYDKPFLVSMANSGPNTNGSQVSNIIFLIIVFYYHYAFAMA